MKHKILIITNLFPSSIEPGRGLYIKQLVERLSVEYEIRVIAPVPWLPSSLAKRWRASSAVPTMEVLDRITVYHPRYFVTPKLFRFLHGFTFAYCIHRLLSTLRKEFPYDLISAHWLYPDVFGAVLATKSDTRPVVAHALGCDVNDYLEYPIRREMIKWALSRTSAIVTKSEEIAGKVARLGIDESRIYSIYNGINRDLFRSRDRVECRVSLGLPLNRKIVLFIGNFSIEKGITYLLQAFAKLRNSRDDTDLYLIGDGPLAKTVRREIDDLEIENCTTLLGRVPHSTIPDYLNAVDLLCLPSLREGCPNVVLESLASGTPVVASAVGAVPEMASRTPICLTFEPANVLKLQHNLNRALDMPKNLDRSFDWPSWENNASAISEIYRSCIKSGRPQRL